jgi:hypothetical protein
MLVGWQANVTTPTFALGPNLQMHARLYVPLGLGEPFITNLVFAIECNMICRSTTINCTTIVGRRSSAYNKLP